MCHTNWGTASRKRKNRQCSHTTANRTRTRSNACTFSMTQQFQSIVVSSTASFDPNPKRRQRRRLAGPRDKRTKANRSSTPVIESAEPIPPVLESAHPSPPHSIPMIPHIIPRIPPVQPFTTFDMSAHSAYVSIEDALDLHHDTFAEYRDLPEFDSNQFCTWYRLLSLHRGAYSRQQPRSGSDSKQFVFQNLHQAGMQDVTLLKMGSSMQIAEADVRDIKNTRFCTCKMYKNYRRCTHTLLIELECNAAQYALRPIFRDITASMRVNGDAMVRCLKTNLPNHRKSAYLVDVPGYPTSIVYQNKNGCVSCATHKYRCSHVVRLMSALGIDSAEYGNDRARKNIEQTKNSTFVQLQGLSTQPVPVPLSHRTEPVPSTFAYRAPYDQYKHRDLRYELLDSQRSGIRRHFRPEATECRNCGNSFDPETGTGFKEHTHEAVLYLLDEGFSCVVHSYECACNTRTHYDGLLEHIHNVNNSELYHHSLLNDRSNYVHACGAPSWHSWHSIKARTYLSNSEHPFPTIRRLKAVWNGFIEHHQTWKFTFQCPFDDRSKTGGCAGECDHVGYDGTVIFLKKHRAKTCCNPTKVHDEQYFVPNSKYSSDRYIVDYQTRLLVQRFVQMHFDKYHRESPQDRLNRRDTSRMYRSLRAHGLQSLVKVLQWIETHSVGISELAPFNEYVHDFIRAVSSDESALVLMHAQLIDLFGGVLPPRNADGLIERIRANENALKEYSPVLRALLLSRVQTIPFPDALYELLSDLASRSFEVLSTYKVLRDLCPHREIAPTEEQLQQHSDWLRSGQYYSATKQRNRPLYAIDGNKERQDGDHCCKNFSEWQKITGGIWILRCLIHGIAIGFHVIPNGEGRNDPMSAIYCHFKKAPKTMCGDFSCGTMPYAMKREPHFFDETVFPTDEIHHKGHCKCSQCFDLAVFKRHGKKEYKLCNGSAVEQRNRVLMKLKTMSAHMALESFMVHTRLLLEMDNRRIEREYRGMKLY